MVNQNFPARDDTDEIPPECRIALAYTPARYRPALEALLLVDARLGKSVARAREPLLGQMRLAWWRERLGSGALTRGEPMLKLVQDYWGQRSADLVPMVDGWEELLADEPHAEAALALWAEGRGRAFAAFADLAGESNARAGAAVAGRRWALAERVAHVADPEERATASKLARALPSPARLPRALRGLAVIDGLSARAAVRSEPLFAGRGAPLAAWRLGMFGR